MDAQKQHVYHIENGFFFIPGVQRIGPDGGLLRGKGQRGVHGDGGVHPVILHIAGGLDAVTAQHGVIHSHAAASAVFNHQIRILREDPVQPGQIGPLMLQKSVPRAVRMLIRSRPRLDVIVHLDVAHAVVLHQAADNAGGKFTHLGIAVVQLIPGLFPDTLSVAHEKPLVRLFLCQRAV